MRWIKTLGVVVCNSPAEREKLKKCLSPVFLALEDEIRPLPFVGLYLYRQTEQPKATGDGICWKDVTLDGKGTLYVIGISCEALERGTEYTQFLFLHELAHIRYPEKPGAAHTLGFHEELDHMIALFNQRTGGSLKNDYCP